MSIGPAREGYCNKHRIHRKPCLVCAAEATPPPPSETGATAEARRIAEEIAPRHLIVEGDCWFSCPMAKEEGGDYSACCDDSLTANPECNCGRERIVERIALALDAAKRSAHLEDARAGCPKLKNPPRKRSKRPPGGQK
jgi:hypothetical protein